MTYQQLGASTLSVSQIGYGCMSLKNGNSENELLLHTAFEKGINFFDTADLYDKGANESLVGKVFKEKRKEVIIATKVGNQWRPDGTGWDWNPTKKYILSAVEESLKHLQTDYIDLYQLHGGTIDDPIDETIEAFETLQQQGKIRFYGISSIRPNVIREYAQRSKIVSVMMQYSLLDRRPEEFALSFLKEKGIGVITRGSVAQGLLIDKPAKPYLNYEQGEVEKAAKAVRDVSSKERTVTQTALRFVLANPAITSAIVGMRTMKQLEEALKTIDTPELNDERLSYLQKAVAVNYYDQHR
jgi:aryl-alcohol dehydrogenase-like predicted oxidoreductase